MWGNLISILVYIMPIKVPFEFWYKPWSQTLGQTLCTGAMHSSFVPSTWLEWLVGNKQMCVSIFEILFVPTMNSCQSWHAILSCSNDPARNIIFYYVCCFAFHTRAAWNFLRGNGGNYDYFLVALKCQEWNFLISQAFPAHVIWTNLLFYMRLLKFYNSSRRV